MEREGDAFGIRYFNYSGNGANAVPHYQKLYSRVNHIWINRKGQPSRCAMGGPRPGGTSLLIKVASEPGKYDFILFRHHSSAFLEI